jgi:hypothetical protein
MRAKCGLAGVVVLAVVAVLAVPTATGLTLVKDGEPTSVIVIADEATSSAKAAALELQYHIKKMSGVDLPILTPDEAPPDGATLVLLGKSPLTDELGIDTSALPKEGYVIRTVGDALVILGDDTDDHGTIEDAFFSDHNVRTGTLFGVYALLEDWLGCRWIWPGESGECIPARSTVQLPPLDVKEGPALIRRGFRILANRDLQRPWPPFFDDDGVKSLRQDQRVWARRMRLGRSANLQLDSLFDSWWQRYHVKYPEIFALKADGTRGPGGRGPEDIHMCVSDPKLWELQIDWFKKTRLRFPDRHDLAASESGRSGDYCTCENCRAWDATTEDLPKAVLDALDPNVRNNLKPGEDGLPESLSTRYARYYNELARRVREIDPEGFVTVRLPFRDPPVGVTLAPNILVRYDDLSTAPATESERESARRRLLGWTASDDGAPGPMIMVRLNTPGDSENGMPFNVSRELADNVRFGLERGAKIVDINAMFGHWAAWGPTYYVLTRMMWQGKKADPEALEKEWYAAFGPAEGPVRAYYDFWEKYIRDVRTRPGERQRVSELAVKYNIRWGARILLIGEHYPPEVFVEARRLLDAALAAAANADEAVKERLRVIEISLRDAELTAPAVRLARAALDDEANLPKLKEALEALIAYRREVFPTPAVNVFVQTREEIANRDVLRWEMIEKAKEEAGEADE